MMINGTEIVTYRDAIAAGAKRGHTAWSRGYVSRKSKSGDAKLHIAGGRCAGLYFVKLATWRSTQYYVRQYLIFA
jgi:hypothetical protein